MYKHSMFSPTYNVKNKYSNSVKFLRFLTDLAVPRVSTGFLSCTINTSHNIIFLDIKVMMAVRTSEPLLTSFYKNKSHVAALPGNESLTL